MSWMEIFLNRNLQPEEVKYALSVVFSIEEQTIEIQFEGLDWSYTDENILMLCSFGKIKGDFPTALEVAPTKRELLPAHTRSTVGRLCKHLNSFAVIPVGGGYNPYVHSLIRDVDDYQYVNLHHEKLDMEEPEIEIIDYLQRFTDSITDIKATLADIVKFYWSSESELREKVIEFRSQGTSKEDLLHALIDIRIEAKKMHREDLLQEVIDTLEKPSES
jgi:hypothetical protein